MCFTFNIEYSCHTIRRSKRVQPTRGWTVAAQRSTNCTHSSCPPHWGPFLPFFGQAGQVDPLVGWRCCY